MSGGEFFLFVALLPLGRRWAQLEKKRDAPFRKRTWNAAPTRQFFLDMYCYSLMAVLGLGKIEGFKSSQVKSSQVANHQYCVLSSQEQQHTKKTGIFSWS
jgi:hypothetical protein